MCYTFTNILTYDIENKTKAISCSTQDNRINIQGDYKLLSVFLWPIIFETGNKINLLAEYEIVTQNVLLPLESILQNPKHLQNARLSWFYPNFLMGLHIYICRYVCLED